MITKEQYMSGCEIWLRRKDSVERSYFDTIERDKWDSIKGITSRYYASEEEARLDMLERQLERQLWRLNDN